MMGINTPWPHSRRLSHCDGWATMTNMKKLAAVILGVGLLAGCSSQPAPPSQSTEESPAPWSPEVYVALGDSYSAMGSTALPLDPPNTCVRAQDSYPELLAKELDVETLANVTCQGATTLDVLSSAGEHPPQVDALTPITDLVTLSIGGNDASFILMASCLERGAQESTCQQEHGQQIALEISDLPRRLDVLYEELAKRAPNARVVATGYMPLITSTDDCAAIAPLAATDRQWLSQSIQDINLAVADAAARHGALFVLPDDAAQHTGCSPDPWVDFTGENTGSFPMHPTHAGQQAMADAVARALRA